MKKANRMVDWLTDSINILTSPPISLSLNVVK